MKTRKNPFRTLTAASLLATVLASAPALQAATFTWTGADPLTGSWAPTSTNWETTPTFNNTADLVFNNVTRATSNEIGFNRTVRSITFGDDIDDIWTTNMTNSSVLTFAADSGNASLDVTADSTANITFNGGTGITGSQSLTSQLEIDHNGSGLLTFNRQTAGAGGITKTGTGTFVMTGFNANSFTGPLNVNGGRLVLNNTQGATQDLAAAVAIDLGGGILEARTTGAFAKTLSQNITVSSASTLAYNNTTGTSRALTLNTGSLVLNADLTIQNISADTSLVSPVTIGRAITGTGDLIVDGYNTFTSASTSFGLGRVSLGGNNSNWSGDLVIREGAADIFGDTAVGGFNAGTGDVFLGETANSAGAALNLSASTPTAGGKTFANDIIVNTGGFRTIRGSSDHTYTFSGSVALNGDLTVHNGLYFNDKVMVFTGNITGAGDLNLTAGTLGFITRLSGDNSLWSGDLTISRGTAELRGNAVNSAGTGLITIGAAADSNAAAVAVIPGGTGGTSVSYANNIVVNPGGPRNLNGGNTNNNIMLTGNVTLDGDLTVNHTLSSSDRRIQFSGPISGTGGLSIIRSGGSAETTLRLSGTNTYLGDTIVSNGASLALADSASLASNVLVQAGGRIGGPGTINTNLTLENTAKFYFYAIGISPASYVPMKVNGTVTLDSSFSAADIVGGSRGEAVPWGTYEDGTYTLISNTASTFNTISNFGPANAAHDIAGSGKTVYFQNGGGTDGGGLQIVVTTAVSDPYTAWSGGAAFDDDANKDGIENGLAFLLGAENVNDEASSLLPVAAQSGGSLTITFSMLDAAARGDAALQVQHSSDLGISDPWSTLVTVPDTTDTVDGINFTVTAGTPPLNNVTAIIPASGNAAGGKLFGRLKANP